MFNLTNISVSDFFQLNEDEVIKYLELQSLMKSKNVFTKRKAKELGYLTFGDVSQLKMDMAAPTFENLADSFKVVFGVKKNDYLKSDVVSFFYALNHIKESVKELIKKEKALESEPDPELELAGVNKLNIFGEMATLINLGEKFSKAPTEIETWKYNLVFAILLYDKKKGEVKNKYDELKSEANGSKR